jgi:hypothetical protein
MESFVSLLHVLLAVHVDVDLDDFFKCTHRFALAVGDDPVRRDLAAAIGSRKI